MKKIQKILLSTILTILVINILPSCAPKEKIVYKTKVVYRECPVIDIPAKPVPNEYSSIKLKYNDNIYYCLSLDNAKILTVNWIEYKEWCESIYNSVIDYNNYITNERKKKSN